MASEGRFHLPLRARREDVTVRREQDVGAAARGLPDRARGLVALCAAALLTRAFPAVDLRATLRAGPRRRAARPVGARAFIASMALDAAGMRLLLRRSGAPFRSGGCCPSGSPRGACTRPRRQGSSWPTRRTASLPGHPVRSAGGGRSRARVARKWLVMRSHAAYIGLGAACGRLCSPVFVRFLGGGWLPWGRMRVVADAALALVGSGHRLSGPSCAGGPCTRRSLGSLGARFKSV